MMQRRHFITSVLGFGLAASPLGRPLAWAERDWFEQMDDEFEQVFEATDAAFDKAMREGVAELDQELADIWGTARRLPEPKVWVGYSEDKTTRIIVDYERGEMAIEAFERDEKDLTGAFQDILLQDSDLLDERAALRKKLIEKTRKLAPRPKRKRASPIEPRTFDPTPRQEQKTPAPPKWVARRELSQLIAPRSTPRFIKRNIQAPTGKKRSLARITIPLRPDRIQLSAQKLAEPVSYYANKYKLPPSLIFSIIKNESSFNPRARSHANALGLMQLVPTSGGKDAYSYLQGEPLTPSPEILYDPVQNIELGTTYLHLLGTRFFGKIRDPLARQFSVISAYNTGAGNVAKAFTGKMKLKAAITAINALSPDQVYRHLQDHLPYAETKTYLARVARDTKTFAHWDETA